MRKRAKNRAKAFICLLIIAVLIIMFTVVDSHVRPVITSTATQSAETLVNKIINDAVARLIDKSKLEYSDIIKVVYDNNNNVKSVESNILKLNKFKAEVNSTVIKAVSDYNNGSIRIRLGTLLGNEYLLGRGPHLKFKFDMVNTVSSTFISKFESAGLNQTKHMIEMKLESKVKILIPWYNANTKVKTNILIAETIIVGSVPNSFTQLDISSKVDKILKNTDN